MTTKATNLNPLSHLADGTLVLRVFVGKEFVRVTGVKAGRRVRRSYRLDKMVETER